MPATINSVRSEANLARISAIVGILRAENAKARPSSKTAIKKVAKTVESASPRDIVNAHLVLQQETFPDVPSWLRQNLYELAIEELA